MGHNGQASTLFRLLVGHGYARTAAPNLGRRSFQRTDALAPIARMTDSEVIIHLVTKGATRAITAEPSGHRFTRNNMLSALKLQRNN